MKTLQKHIIVGVILLLTTLFIVGCSSTGSLELQLDANGGLFSSGQETYLLKTDDSASITLPLDPSRDGYTFKGWYFDKDTFLEPFSIDALQDKDLNESITIYAKWEKGIDETLETSFTISFQTNGGNQINPLTINKGESIIIPAEPTKEDSTFEGWYLDANFTTPFSSITSTQDLEDFTLYAKWEESITIKTTEGLSYTLTSDNTYEVTGYTGTDIDVHIPAQHLGIDVTRIGRIESTTAFTSLHLSTHIKSIDDSMFSYASLSSISVSKDNAFYQALDGVLFDKSLKTLVWFPLAKGTSYSVPDGVEHIGEGVFRDNRVITSVTLPDSLISIKDKAFWGTESLIDIVIPDHVISIGWNAFYVSGLETVSFGNSLESIARGAFAGTDISSIILPQTILTIGEEAFANCSNLESITIHATTPPTLGIDAFRNMSFGGYNETLNIYVPNNSVNLYKDEATWETYKDIVTNIA